MSPCRTHSVASRHLLYCFPVHSYWYDEDHTVNLSLQALLASMVQDLNELATDGLQFGDTVPWPSEEICWGSSIPSLPCR